jgi:hypothetical protein
MSTIERWIGPVQINILREWEKIVFRAMDSFTRKIDRISCHFFYKVFS